LAARACRPGPDGREALAPHSGRASERVHLDARVVGDRGEAGDPVKVLRLRAGVLLEGLVRLERVLFGRWRDAGIVQVEKLEAGHGTQDAPDLGHLAGAARGDEEAAHAHPPPEVPARARRRASACAARSTSTPEIARSRSPSSSSRRKGSPSAVPCTSTRPPLSVPTTFMSTCARTSSR